MRSVLTGAKTSIVLPSVPCIMEDDD